MNIKPLFFLILLLTSGFIAHTQPGFNKKYDFGSAASFHNVILKEDTLIIAGTTKNLATDQWGALFVKMDTLGNIFDYQNHLDTMGGQYAFQEGYSIIPSNDGGYLMVGVVFDRATIFMLKLQNNGELISFHEYARPPNTLTLLPRKVVAVDNGYILFSLLQLDNGASDVFVTRINEEGAILWEQSYGDYEKSEGLNDVWVSEDKNTFVIGCSRGTSTPLYPVQNLKCSQSWIFAIDSLGAVKWQWAGAPCEEGGVKGIQHTHDNGWIYLTHRLKAFNQWTWGFTPIMVKRDDDFDFIWERQLAESYLDLNRGTDIHPGQDDNWIGAGKWILPTPFYGYSNDYIYQAGCLFSYSNQGDSLWTRCDTIILENEHETGSFEYGNFVVLPSGSIIAAGSFGESLGGGAGKTWAWLVKVDKNGCMEDTCTITGLEMLTKRESGISIFPNPAQNHVFFEIPDRISSQSSQILIMDITRQVIWGQRIEGGGQKVVWNTSSTANGIYFYQWMEAGQLMDSGKIIIQK